jgi:hypothetical protein
MSDVFRTDLNTRERRRLAEQLQVVANTCDELGKALLVEDDAKAFAHYIVYALAGPKIAQELLEVMTQMAEAIKAREDLERGERPE